MALAETTLSAAVAASDNVITVASATSIAAGRLFRIGGESMQATKAYVNASTDVPVRRALDGTVQQAHPASARVVHGDPADFSTPAPGTVTGFPVAGRAREVRTYSAAGAIELPKPGADMLAILYGTAAAFTLADPTKDMDGSILYVIASTAAAHTITNTTGFGGAGSSYDVLTFAAGAGVGVWFVACDEKWYILNSAAMAGTATNLLATIS